jgi:hypothetical protein
MFEIGEIVLAALPPHVQEQREVDEIVRELEKQNILVTQISKIAFSEYLVHTNHGLTFKAIIVYLPAHCYGPRPFMVVFSEEK